MALRIIRGGKALLGIIFVANELHPAWFAVRLPEANRPQPRALRDEAQLSPHAVRHFGKLAAGIPQLDRVMASIGDPYQDVRSSCPGYRLELPALPVPEREPVALFG